MKNALVTLIGGGGFLGRYVAQELLKRGARVRIVQRNPREAWFLKPQGGLGQTQFIAADVTLPETIERAVAGSDAVVNLVGTLNGNFHAVHVKGAQAVAQAASRAGAKALVHVSALGASADSASEYGRSKAAGEKVVRDAFAKATILRPSYLFGREDKFVNRFADMLVSGSALPLLGSVKPVLAPEAKFQPAWVVDVAEAVARSLADPKAHGGKTFELGGPDVWTMAGLNKWLAREIGRDPAFVELPDSIGGLIAMLPGTPISSDQWRMLKNDNVVSSDGAGFTALGIDPTPLASIAPNWLVRFRRHGRFTAIAA